MRGRSMRIVLVPVCLLIMGAFDGRAVAQLPGVRLPPVQVPAVSQPLGTLPDTLNAVSGTARGLAGARSLRVERLAREHRDELDRDPFGELVVRAEVVSLDISDGALKRALAENFLLRRTRELAELGIKVSVLQTPEGWSASRGLKRLRKLDPAGTYDFNHIYLDSGELLAPLPGVMRPANPMAQDADGGGSPRRVGLVDSGVDAAHEMFTGVRVRHFGCADQVIPAPHGTAVAAILASRRTVDEIYAADVYCGRPDGGAIDAVAAALGWLAHERVAVINVSLVGPRNALLEQVVSTLVSRGFLIVAAVGNDGPAAPPLFPAAFDGVVGVTAVDKNHHVLLEACRGKQVDFAARGADLEAATQAPNTYTAVRGTSFAAPLVAALFAPELPLPDAAQRERELDKWSRLAQDLGKQGRDDTYGAGELASPPEAAPGKTNK